MTDPYSNDMIEDSWDGSGMFWDENDWGSMDPVFT